MQVMIQQTKFDSPRWKTMKKDRPIEDCALARQARGDTQLHGVLLDLAHHAGHLAGAGDLGGGGEESHGGLGTMWREADHSKSIM